MRKIVEVGETLRLYVSFVDIDTGTPLDPSSLSAGITEPDGVSYVIEYPGANFIREQAGAYFVRVQTDQEGTHHYRVVANFAAGDIDIRDGKFDAEPNV